MREVSRTEGDAFIYVGELHRDARLDYVERQTCESKRVA